MYLPHITPDVLAETINNLWEDGSEFSQEIQFGAYDDDAVAKANAVKELSDLASYIDYLQNFTHVI